MPDNIEYIRAYRSQLSKRDIADRTYKVAMFLLEVSTVTAVLGRGLKYVAREIDDGPQGRRIRFPVD